MISRRWEAGRSKLARHVLAAGLVAFMGCASGAFALGGCGAASRPSSSELPEHVVDKLAECGKQGPKALQPVHYDIAFDVFVTEGGHVENVLLKESTLHIDEVEECMAQALYGLSTSDETVSLRRRKLAPDAPLAPGRAVTPGRPVMPEERALLGQGVGVLEVLLLGGAIVSFGLAYYQVTVNYFAIQNHSKPAPHHHPPPQSEEPPAPSSAPAPEPPPQDAPKIEGPTPPVPLPLPDCPRNETFSPVRTDNAMGCTDKNGNVRCYSSKHHPCAGVHTHGKLSYQEIRNGVCKAVERRAVHCEGLFKISGPCGSTPTVECKTGGPEISGTHEE